MKAKLQRLRALGERHYEKALVGAGLALAAGTASADLETVLDTFVAAIITGIGTTFEKIGPLLALVFGVAFAWRWIRKSAAS